VSFHTKGCRSGCWRWSNLAISNRMTTSKHSVEQVVIHSRIRRAKGDPRLGAADVDGKLARCYELPHDAAAFDEAWGPPSA
jgi:hypothetical protein